MTLRKGQSIWAVRLSASEPDDWTRFTLGDAVGLKGGTATVYRIDANTTPPLLAKLFHSTAMLDRIANDNDYSERLHYLALFGPELRREFPWCAWPRRIVYATKDPTEAQARKALLGLTLPALDQHRALADLLQDKSARRLFTQERAIHLAITLADQLHRLHSHPWKFVVGDLSPNNLMVDYQCSTISFIDLDAIRFTPVTGSPGFDSPGTTPGYRSPACFGSDATRLTAAHDDFVLAILIFQILMAISGVDGAHPFLDVDAREDDLIRERRFPYADAWRSTHVADKPAAVYAGWHRDLRDAFEGVFTGRRPMTAKDWAELLPYFRRCLR